MDGMDMLRKFLDDYRSRKEPLVKLDQFFDVVASLKGVRDGVVENMDDSMIDEPDWMNVVYYSLIGYLDGMLKGAGK